MCLAGRALHSTGLVSPELLAAAQEEDVTKALAAGFDSQLLQRTNVCIKDDIS